MTRPRWLMLLPPALTVPLALLALAESSEWFTTAGGFEGFELALLVWSWSPAVLLVLLGLWAIRSGPGRAGRAGRTVVGVGGLLLLGLFAWAYWVIRTDESSTAALGYLFVPLYGWVVVVLTAAALGVAALVGRRTSR